MESLAVEKIQKIQPELPLYVERAENINPSKPINVVILFGWTNSSLKNVSKIALYWRKKGNFHILYYVAPSWPYIYFSNKAKTVTKEFIPFLQEWGIFNGHQQKIPLLIAHCFSNGGAIGLAGLIEACRAQSLNLRYSAIIIDSAPGSGLFAFGKIYTATLQNPISKFFGLIFYHAVTIIGLPLLYIFLKLLRKQPIMEFIITSLRKKVATNCPRLFIYSKNDEIVPYKKIQKEIKISEDLGIDTDVLSFENSGHVRNWVDNKQIYEEKIDDFLSSRGLLELEKKK